VFYGPQFEAGSVPTSFIPTYGPTVTRPAETLEVAGSNIPLNTTAMSFQVDGLATVGSSDAVRVFDIYKGSADSILFYIHPDGDYTLFTEDGANAFTITTLATGYSPGINQAFNGAVRVTNDPVQNIAANGSSAVAEATDGLPEDLVTESKPLRLGINGDVKNSGSLVIGKVRMWGDDIGDDGIEEATL